MPRRRPLERFPECRLGGRPAFGLALAVLLAACSPRPFVVQPPEDVAEGLSERAEAARAPAPGTVELGSPAPGTPDPGAPTARPPAALGPHDYDPNPRPLSFCYSSQMNTPEEVMARARELCPNNGRLQFQEEDFLFNGCALLQPYRVTFICTPGPRPDSPYD